MVTEAKYFLTFHGAGGYQPARCGVLGQISRELLFFRQMGTKDTPDERRDGDDERTGCNM